MEWDRTTLRAGVFLALQVSVLPVLLAVARGHACRHNSTLMWRAVHALCASANILSSAFCPRDPVSMGDGQEEENMLQKGGWGPWMNALQRSWNLSLCMWYTEWPVVGAWFVVTVAPPPQRKE